MPLVARKAMKIVAGDVFVPHPVYTLMGPYNEHAAGVNPERGVPGKPLSTNVEPVHNSYRVRYENGAIYRTPAGDLAWVHGAIGARYDQLGGPSSWLGLPLRDEEPMSEEGRASVFERGTIYWWPDVGAIELNEVLVHYTGLMCFGETDVDGGSDSDEPYVIVGSVSPIGTGEIRTRIYGEEDGTDGVDAGESRPDLIEVYRGKPYGLTLHILLLEHDEGDPNKYRAEVEQAVREGMDQATPAIVAELKGVPYVGPALAMAAKVVLPKLVPVFTDLINDLLGTGDDELGSEVIRLTAKEMVLLSARTGNSNFNGIGYKVESPLMSRQGATYKAYFGLVTA